eukprot:TRINITY_DN25117_c0_g1_i3.p1 TRINITY_DN25117_c0_g1~~TRINITY_DN25117_c0_g1_i3.p1  ORF type:complete len:412 (-),score=52.87 TRINITY_DN25117_c0_g1_i3:473-1657(-)
MASCLLKVPGSKSNWVTFKYIPRLQTRRVYKVYAVASPVQKQFNFGQGSDTQVEPSNNKVTHKEIFTTSDGRQIDCLPWDYGFRSGVGRMYQEGYGRVPSNVLELLFQNIVAEFRGLLMFQEWMQPDKSMPESEELRSKLKELTLDDEAVRQREKRLAATNEHAVATAPAYIKYFYHLLCFTLDLFYEGRPIERFWTLEVVARIPYFAYNSILHFYESVGWWRAGGDLRRLHFAEEWNELHHLQIMETLGGDQGWFDRFLAHHSAIAYYWLVVLFYFISPKHSYHFMEMIEGHARDTYTEFILQNKHKLKDLPPPKVACEYYMGSDLYLFDELQSPVCSGEQQFRCVRRPNCNNLLDVFVNIRDDEIEHVKTMDSCKEQKIACEIDWEADNKIS